MKVETNHTKAFYNTEIPVDWEIKRLGKLGTVVSGLTYSPADICEKTGVLVLRSSNVQGGRITFDDNVYVKVKEDDFNPVKRGDILICVRNGSKSLIGKCAQIIEEADYPGVGKIKIVRTPIMVSGELPKIRMQAPLLGEHTSQVLAELGYSEGEIRQLIDEGIAFQYSPQSEPTGRKETTK